jgi:cysteine desulfurase
VPTPPPISANIEAVKPIYMDHNATTPVHPEVAAAMAPFAGERYANPSSLTHAPGRDARDAVEEARSVVARFLGAESDEIVFTAGATESDNMALKGVAWAAPEDNGGKDQIITSPIEHRAVLDTCRWLGERGLTLTLLPVDRHGLVDPGDVSRAITPRTLIVSVMHANSEIGTVEPVGEIGAICRERGVLFHCDATQTVGKLPVSVGALGCDLLALSAHKFYGPKGVGALYIRRRTRLEPLLHGGGQEKGRRSGTLNVAGIVGLAAACRLAESDLEAERARLVALRTRLHDGIIAAIPGAHLNGSPGRRLPHNLHFSFEDVEGEALILAMRRVALSSGSACSSAREGPSYVLKAIGVPDALAHASVRFGLGRSNDAAQVDEVLASLGESVARLRAISARG